MKTALITGKTDTPALAPLFEELQAHLKACGWGSFVLPKAYVPKKPFDIVFCIGGDGSFLSCARTLAPFGKPLVLVYAGHLGFLPSIHPEALSPRALEPFLAEDAPWMERIMLKGCCACTDTLCALNEFYFTNDQKGSLSDYLVKIDGAPVMQARADGLILSTPTGSTAYNLSAGGPILMPSLQALIITPVCSHILGERPLVVDAQSHIEIVNINKRVSQVWADGQEVISLGYEETFSLTKPLKVLTQPAPPRQFFSNLSHKLGWNSAPRKEPPCWNG